MYWTRSPERDDRRGVGGIFIRDEAVLSGFLLISLGVLLALTVVLLPLGIMIAVVGVVLFVWGLGVPHSKPSTESEARRPSGRSRDVFRRGGRSRIWE